MSAVDRSILEPTPADSADEVRDDGELTGRLPRPGRGPTNAPRGLLVIGDGFVATHKIPESGTLIIGRAPECDVCIDAPHVSRRHLLIHAGPEIRVEDLGSANGTRVAGGPLERGRAVILGPGAIVELGSTMLVVQAGYEASRPRRIWFHDYFEARLEEECHRAVRTKRTFALLRLRTDGKKAKAMALEELILGALRTCDVVASYAPDEYEVLIPDATREQSRDVVRRVRAALEKGGAPVQIGVAYYPQDGRVPEALMARASAELSAGTAEQPADLPIVVASPVMRELHKLVARVAVGTINTLVLGETGTGKEIIAERIHALSRRVDKPLLRINCAALAENLLESELFGHERGAFTGATEAKPGLLEVADGGTVFLDEIGDMSLGLQAKLLRTLEDGTVRRVGGLTPRPIDIRIVAATHRDLEQDASDGRFRRDLFFRIAGVTVIVPPLRERIEEIPLLAEAFADQARRRQQLRHPITLSAEALQWLVGYDWPGNIRELRNVIERAVLLCADGVIGREQLPASKLGRTYRLRDPSQTFDRLPSERPEPTAVPEVDAGAGERATSTTDPLDLKASMKQRERELVSDALARAAGNQTQAAKLLGVSRRTLIARIEEFGLPRPRKREG